jgi:hypothetical protein
MISFGLFERFYAEQGQLGEPSIIGAVASILVRAQIDLNFEIGCCGEDFGVGQSGQGWGSHDIFLKGF